MTETNSDIGRGTQFEKIWPTIAIVVLAIIPYLNASSKLTANLFYLLLLAFFLVEFRRLPALVRQTGRIEQAALVFFLSIAVSITASGNWPISEAKYFIALCLYWFFVRVAFLRASEDLFFTTLAASLTLLLASGFLQRSDALSPFIFGSLNNNRATPLLAFAFFWVVYRAWQCEGWRRVAGVALGSILIVATFDLLGSRSMIIAFVIFMFGLIITDLLAKRGAKQLLAVLLVVLLLLLAVGSFAGDVLLQKVTERGWSYRIDIWADVYRYAMRHNCLLLGCGKQDDWMFAGIAENPHGLFTSTLFYYGVIGFSGLLLLLVTVMRHARGYITYWLPAFCGYSIFTHTAVLQKPDPLWIYFWLPVFMVAAIPAKRNA